MNDKQLIRAAVPLLVDWCAAVRRPLPWRLEPTPYHVWISEIMLQQTRIEAVIPYYERFLAALPDVAALAAVDDDRLMKLWEGLGYYSRARNLKKAAQQVIERFGGALPATAEELRSLSGIGEYTAGAIASLAFHKPEPAVDGNVLRVLSRLLASKDDVMSPAVRKSVTTQLRDVYPSGERAALLTEGLMELGETVCIPNGEPLCDACPAAALCRARAAGDPTQYPVRSAPKEALPLSSPYTVESSFPFWRESLNITPGRAGSPSSKTPLSLTSS
jgi:A/G-specific adenine glycosylase